MIDLQNSSGVVFKKLLEVEGKKKDSRDTRFLTQLSGLIKKCFNVLKI